MRDKREKKREDIEKRGEGRGRRDEREEGRVDPAY